MNSSDEDLIKGCIENNKFYQNLFYKRFWNKCHYIAFYYTGDYYAKDIVQDSFIKIFNNLNNYSGKSLNNWVVTTTVNTAIDFLRRKKEFLLLSKEENKNYIEELYSENPEDELNKLSAIELFENKYKIPYCKLFEIIDSLPKMKKEIFKLYVFDNLTHEEISQYLQIKNVSSRAGYFIAKKMILNKIK